MDELKEENIRDCVLKSFENFMKKKKTAFRLSNL